MRKLTRAFAPIVFVLSLLLSGCALPMPSSSMVSMDELPAYSDSAYVEIDGNQPYFTDADKQETEAFEEYSGFGLSRTVRHGIRQCRTGADARRWRKTRFDRSGQANRMAYRQV